MMNSVNPFLIIKLIFRMQYTKKISALCPYKGKGIIKMH